MIRLYHRQLCKIKEKAIQILSGAVDSLQMCRKFRSGTWPWYTRLGQWDARLLQSNRWRLASHHFIVVTRHITACWLSAIDYRWYSSGSSIGGRRRMLRDGIAWFTHSLQVIKIIASWQWEFTVIAQVRQAALLQNAISIWQQLNTFCEINCHKCIKFKQVPYTCSFSRWLKKFSKANPNCHTLAPKKPNLRFKPAVCHTTAVQRCARLGY